MRIASSNATSSVFPLIHLYFLDFCHLLLGLYLSHTCRQLWTAYLYSHLSPKLQTQYLSIYWKPPFVCLTGTSRSIDPRPNHVILTILFPGQFGPLPAVCISEWHQHSPHQTSKNIPDSILTASSPNVKFAAKTVVLWRAFWIHFLILTCPCEVLTLCSPSQHFPPQGSHLWASAPSSELLS